MARTSGGSGLSAFALAVALVSLGLAISALLRQCDSTPDYTQSQRDDARVRLCTAFATVRTGVATNTNREPPGGFDDVAGALAASANARVALFDGGQYLLARMDPAAPEVLAAQVRGFADLLMDIGAAATAGVPNSDPVQASRLEQAESASARIDALCA